MTTIVGGGEVQETFADREKDCMRCRFYKQFELAHRSDMRKDMRKTFGKLVQLPLSPLSPATASPLASESLLS